ncbi:GNAT family N-acetyltransferase [Simiduia aestuariiviva]|uniref:BioF2-like acetyltransferase domain-containing protein n=1 Tax=Simiduia aestuariiviva TaxID=1510459 RepID=A0A839UUG9_9GAMM|nr:GNAT family N-acetyltransferase [Simiduia aestuariiviva]MBB3170079.1 hypothetical protein [Simiduia aestuariiviva]
MSDQSVPVVYESPKSPFKTRAWLNAWLSTYSDSANIRVLTLTHSNAECFEGNFYLSPLKMRGVRFEQLVPVGCSNNYLATPRSEYNCFNDVAVLGDLLNYLRKSRSTWHQLYLPDMSPSAELEEELVKLSRETRSMLSQAKCDLSYRIAPMAVESYLAQLSRSTRARYFGNRKRLSQLGEVQLRSLHLNNWGDFVEILNRMHRNRWMQDCYSQETAQFMHAFLSEGLAEGVQPQLSVMEVEGTICSVLLDITYAGTRYNLQSGFIERFATSVQLGSLHLGYAIEEALNLGLGYDFLAGTGRKDNYKAKIATQCVPLTTYRLERGLLGYARKVNQWITRGSH